MFEEKFLKNTEKQYFIYCYCIHKEIIWFVQWNYVYGFGIYLSDMELYICKFKCNLP